jgi:hypothetical protein
MKGLEMFWGAFIAEFDATEVAEPTERSFDDISRSAQSAPVETLRMTVEREGRPDSPLGNLADDRGGPIGRVSLEDCRLAAWTSTASCDGGKFVQQLDGAFSVRFVCRTGGDYQRHPLCVGDYVPLTAIFRSVSGIRSGMVPPKSARMDALSIKARESRIRPRFPRQRKSRRWISGQTPASVQSRIRRQHVTPLPQPISRGSIFQDNPVLRTKMIPIKHARSDTGGRPPLGDALRFGNNGSISFHNVLGNNAGIGSPPC